jgi:hypothetical protein
VAGNGVLVVAMGLVFAALAQETHRRQVMLTGTVPATSTAAGQDPRPAAS